MRVRTSKVELLEDAAKLQATVMRTRVHVMLLQAPCAFHPRTLHMNSFALPE